MLSIKRNQRNLSTPKVKNFSFRKIELLSLEHPQSIENSFTNIIHLRYLVEKSHSPNGTHRQ